MSLLTANSFGRATDSPRLFFGIPVEQPSKRELETIVEEYPLAGESKHLRWLPSSDWHLTLKFIGGWPANRLPELIATASELEFAAGSIEFEVIGPFPERRPVVVAARRTATMAVKRAAKGVQLGPITRLANQLDIALAQSCGIARENRPFSPHITLARARSRNALDGSPVMSCDFHAVIKSMALFVSQAQPDGGRYRIVHSWPVPLGQP